LLASFPPTVMCPFVELGDGIPEFALFPLQSFPIDFLFNHPLLAFPLSGGPHNQGLSPFFSANFIPLFDFSPPCFGSSPPFFSPDQFPLGTFLNINSTRPIIIESCVILPCSLYSPPPSLLFCFFCEIAPPYDAPPHRYLIEAKVIGFRASLFFLKYAFPMLSLNANNGTTPF